MTTFITSPAVYRSASLAALLITSLAIAAFASAAQFNARVSDRELALNDSLRLTFTTMRPQRSEVDIAAAIRDALNLPQSRDHWRILGEPTIVQNEKIKDVSVTIVAMPRHAGALSLPVIPVTWLDGDRQVSFGEVEVTNHLMVGQDTQPVPAELEAIGGFTWGITQADILAIDPRSSVTTSGGQVEITTSSGLQLILIEDQLTEALLNVADLNLETAQTSFVGRWGNPREHADGTLHWIVGWLEISVTSSGSGCLLRFSHEGIRSTALASKVSSDVFNVLEGTATIRTAAAAQRAQADAATATEPALPEPRLSEPLPTVEAKPDGSLVVNDGTSDTEVAPDSTTTADTAETALSPEPEPGAHPNTPTEAELQAEFERRVRELSGD